MVPGNTTLSPQSPHHPALVHSNSNPALSLSNSNSNPALANSNSNPNLSNTNLAGSNGLTGILSVEVANMRAQIQRLESQIGQQQNSSSGGSTGDTGELEDGGLVAAGPGVPPPSYEKAQLAQRLGVAPRVGVQGR